MRKWLLLFLPLLLTACDAKRAPDYLAYQTQRLTVEAVFTLEESEFPATLELAAAEYDASGQMLTRNAVLTLQDPNILSGVRFELLDGEVYLSSGVLRIPLSEDAVTERISDLISLFCIDAERYYSAEPEGEQIRVVYVSGENQVELLWNPVTSLPDVIDAQIKGRHLAASIESIRIES